MFLIRPPRVYRWLFKDAVFRKDENDKTVYLTFDDGPTPEVSEMVLNLLQKEGVVATFFMLGKNARENPKLVDRTKELGHTIANHGMNHINGWNCSTADYIKNCEDGKKELISSLFRPPYGKLTLSQYKRIKENNTVVLWDIISGDFDSSLSLKEVENNVLNNVRSGSVIVMHDSKKAFANLKGSLPNIIHGLKEKGYQFGKL